MEEKYPIEKLLTEPIVMKLNAQEQKFRIKVMNSIIYNKEAYKFENDDERKLAEDLQNRNILRIEDGKIVSIYPVSAKKTNKKVILNNNLYAYAMCAIDAIGFHYTFNCPIRIESECQYCNEEICLEIENEKIKVIKGTNNIHILHTDLKNTDNWACCCCNIMHFFVCEKSLNNWQKENSINAKTFAVNLETANKIAKSLFSVKTM